MEAPKLLSTQYPGLISTYHTPHVCGQCGAHIADDWSFCPECGRPALHKRTSKSLLGGWMRCRRLALILQWIPDRCPDVPAAEITIMMLSRSSFAGLATRMSSLCRKMKASARISKVGIWSSH